VVYLLRANPAPGSFLDTPAAALAGPGRGNTWTGPGGAGGPESLDFLTPCDKPGVLGLLGTYEVREVIGRGGMGVVLKAFDEQLNRVVAIKVMAPQFATSATARQRFRREARAAAAVAHDHVIAIYAVEEANGLPSIVMYHVAGASLQDRLDRTGPLALTEVLRIGMQTAQGLAAAHAQGLVHRDVKPANILLENGVERVKLTDFGLARAADDASLTQSGVIAGTPQYMSPEQARGEPVDHRSDLFSLGSVLYATCTGRPPFRADNNLAALKRVCEDAASPLREASPETPDWLCAIIAKLHAKDPAARYQTAGEVAEVLGRFLAHVQHPSAVPLPAAASPPSTEGREVVDGKPEPARRRRWWPVAVATLVLVIAGLGITEAAGVTRIRTAVTRVFGTDGPLVAEGAAPEGPASKPGPGEVAAAPAPAAPDPKVAGSTPPADSPCPFVVLSRNEAPDCGFATLAEAVAGANHSDTIEIRGNGPFATPPIFLNNKALTIRAGSGYCPVLLLGEADPAKVNLLTYTQLTLEGLEFHRTDRRGLRRLTTIVSCPAASGSIQMTNCRVVLQPDSSGVQVFGPSGRKLVVRNCHFVMDRSCNVGRTFLHSGDELVVEGNLFVGAGTGFNFPCGSATRDATLRMRHNTFALHDVLTVFAPLVTRPAVGPSKPPYVHIQASENILAPTEFVLTFCQGTDDAAIPPEPVSGAEAEAALPGLVDWHEHRNGYGTPPSWIVYTANGFHARRTSVADWERFWGLKDTGSLQGPIFAQCGRLPSLDAEVPLDRLCDPTSFRLADDSVGKGAGEGGRDLGADVDLVGPGPAYERWKTTPAYQQWLRETGQAR
jgi:serine/threonine protein kinase